jgi:DNA-binding NarL/FixJ family response regulator
MNPKLFHMNNSTIVIADDHAMIRDGLRTLIQRHANYKIVGEAVSGQEALDLYTALKPDLLILDISMPDINGMDVLKEIIQRDTAARVIIFSMYDGEDYISRCMELGVRGYVMKNESSEELEQAISVVLSGDTYFSRHVQDVIFKKYSMNMGRRKSREEMIKLTQREIEIVKLISAGLTSQQMADKLSISPRTVETHRANLMKKVGVRNAIELVKKLEMLELI